MAGNMIFNGSMAYQWRGKLLKLANGGNVYGCQARLAPQYYY